MENTQIAAFIIRLRRPKLALPRALARLARADYRKITRPPEMLALWPQILGIQNDEVTRAYCFWAKAETLEPERRSPIERSPRN
jgi:hypothetical protein